MGFFKNLGKLIVAPVVVPVKGGIAVAKGATAAAVGTAKGVSYAARHPISAAKNTANAVYVGSGARFVKRGFVKHFIDETKTKKFAKQEMDMTNPDQPRAFQKFFKGWNSQKVRGVSKGVGLGFLGLALLGAIFTGGMIVPLIMGGLLAGSVSLTAASIKPNDWKDSSGKVYDKDAKAKVKAAKLEKKRQHEIDIAAKRAEHFKKTAPVTHGTSFVSNAAANASAPQTVQVEKYVSPTGKPLNPILDYSKNQQAQSSQTNQQNQSQSNTQQVNPNAYQNKNNGPTAGM
jgi:hypothetical protein